MKWSSIAVLFVNTSHLNAMGRSFNQYLFCLFHWGRGGRGVNPNLGLLERGFISRKLGLLERTVVMKTPVSKTPVVDPEGVKSPSLLLCDDR